jgi:hypothetical protein
MTQLHVALLPEQNQDAGDNCQDGKQDDGGAEVHTEDADDADEDEINGKHKHADVFCDHGAILNGWIWLSRAKVVREAHEEENGEPWWTLCGESEGSIIRS